MENLIFRQLFDRETCTYTYILADEKTTEAMIIDPVLEQFERDQKILQELGLQLKYIFETHVHADHVTGAGRLKKECGGKIGIRSGVGVDCADVQIIDGDVFNLGDIEVKAIETSGHTDSCICYFAHDRVFTGDTLFIRGCGRTDFQMGSPVDLFKSVREKLFTLPEETLVYPGHDYNGRTVSTIGEEKKHNPRLHMGQSLDQFVDIMENLNLKNPEKMNIAVPANMNCGMDI